MPTGPESHAMRARTFTLIVVLVALAGCASAPFETEGVALELTPAEAREDPAAARDRLVIWGGNIARARNLEAQTMLEIVAFPLSDRTQRPRVDNPTLGRFRVYVDGYLETARFAPGREITVRGRVAGTETGQIGEADYVFPVIRKGELELWAPRAERREGDRVQFRFGVIFGN